MLLAHLIVVLAVTGRAVDEARTRVSGDEIGRENLPRAAVAKKRMRVGQADEIGAFPRTRDELRLRDMARSRAGIAFGLMAVVGRGDGVD